MNNLQSNLKGQSTDFTYEGQFSRQEKSVLICNNKYVLKELINHHKHYKETVINISSKVQNVHTEHISKMPNVFHVFSYNIAATKAWWNFMWLRLGNSKRLVKVSKRLRTWFNTERVSGDLKHNKGRVNFDQSASVASTWPHTGIRMWTTVKVLHFVRTIIHPEHLPMTQYKLCQKRGTSITGKRLPGNVIKM